MNIKRNALVSGILLLLLLTSACGGAAATQAPVATSAPNDYVEPAATEAPAAIEAQASTYVPSVNDAQAPNQPSFGVPNSLSSLKAGISKSMIAGKKPS